VYVDGDVIEDGNGIIRDRRILAEYGVLVVLIAINPNTRRVDGDVEIIPRGVNITDERYIDIVSAVNKTVAESKDASLYELTTLVKKSVRKLFYRDRQFPMIIPVLIED
jgi:ribonuclease J